MGSNAVLSKFGDPVYAASVFSRFTSSRPILPFIDQAHGNESLYLAERYVRIRALYVHYMLYAICYMQYGCIFIVYVSNTYIYTYVYTYIYIYTSIHLRTRTATNNNTT